MIGPVLERSHVGHRLDADVIRAGVEVLTDAGDDRHLVAPGHDRVDQRVRSVVLEVGLVESEPAQVVDGSSAPSR